MGPKSLLPSMGTVVTMGDKAGLRTVQGEGSRDHLTLPSLPLGAQRTLWTEARETFNAPTAPHRPAPSWACSPTPTPFRREPPLSPELWKRSQVRSASPPHTPGRMCQNLGRQVPYVAEQ